jgi:ribokinase
MIAKGLTPGKGAKVFAIMKHRLNREGFTTAGSSDPFAIMKTASGKHGAGPTGRRLCTAKAAPAPPRRNRGRGQRYRSAMTKRPKVTVLGSLNMDISVTVPRLPAPGATVLGDTAQFTPGGKGANQAVAAARLGADVRMIGCVGDDDFGRQLLAALRAEGIDADAVRTVTSVPSGLAMIAVDQAGENLIVVAPGANHQVGPADVAKAAPDDGGILVISAEIPGPAITQALAQTKGRAILNLAPAPANAAELVTTVGENLDWLVVNESEAAAVLGRPVSGLAGAKKAATDLTANGPRHAVVTAGAHGAALASADAPGGAHTVEGFKVNAVDTVGAGDTFVGALAVAITAGVPPPEALRAAAAAGATAVTRPGAQTAMPHPADILAATGVTWPAA